jgi:hypothetical protein
MNRSTVVSLIVVIVAGVFLALRAETSEMGKVYTEGVEFIDADSGVSWTKQVEVAPSRRDEDGVSLSMNRTVGLWLSAILTLCIFSFLIGDSVIYKMAEAVFLGVSAAYAMVVGFWGGIIPNLMGNITPGLIRDHFLPGLNADKEPRYLYLTVLVLSVMMLMRLAPKGQWIARWPLAFFIGATAGVKLVGFLEADFVQQIKSTILPLYVAVDGEFDWRASLKNLTIMFGVLTTLVYFFFSFEHKGVVGGAARLGIWFLMITFGAGFAFTVMGRIALLSERLKFLFDDWLWLIDPLSQRIGL